jgi:hypothetical protein
MKYNKKQNNYLYAEEVLHLVHHLLRLVPNLSFQSSVVCVLSEVIHKLDDEGVFYKYWVRGKKGKGPRVERNPRF